MMRSKPRLKRGKTKDGVIQLRPDRQKKATIPDQEIVAILKHMLISWKTYEAKR